MPAKLAETPPTARQMAVFRCYWEQVCSAGYQPSYKEVMKRLKFASPNAVAEHLRGLERHGWVTLGARKNRQQISFLRTPDGKKFRGFKPVEDS